MKKSIVRGLQALVVWFLSPVFILTLFGPMMIVAAMKFIQGDGFRSFDPNTTGELSTLFQNKAMPGLVDYTAQYYTAILVSVFWFRFCLEKGLVDHALTLARSSSGNSNAHFVKENARSLFFVVLTVSAVVVFLDCCMYF